MQVTDQHQEKQQQRLIWLMKFHAVTNHLCGVQIWKNIIRRPS
jgi:hypothetical protein